MDRIIRVKTFCNDCLLSDSVYSYEEAINKEEVKFVEERYENNYSAQIWYVDLPS